MATRRRASRRTLTGSLSDIDRRLSYVEKRPRPSRLANQVVTRAKIQPRAVATDQIQLLSITNTLIEKRTIGEAELNENSVTNLQVAPQAISTESFAPGAVNNAAMGTDAVDTDNVQNGSITEPKLADGSASTDKIENGAITTAKLADGSVTEPKIASSAVSESKIAGGAVSEGKIAPGAVSESKISSGAVSSSKIAGSAVTNSKIGNGAVTTAKIANDAVTGAKIANGSINNRMIEPNNAIATGIGEGSGIDVSFSGRSTGGGVYTVSAAFGGGFSNVARGNHRHTITISSTSSSTGNALSGLDEHNHSFSYLRANAQTNTPSTERIKKEISNYEIEDAKKILNLKLKRFKYKNEKRSLHDSLNREWMFGYLAEEVQESGVDEVLGYDDEGRPSSVDYGLLSVLLVEVVKEQQKDIENLKTEVERLRRSND